MTLLTIPLPKIPQLPHRNLRVRRLVLHSELYSASVLKEIRASQYKFSFFSFPPEIRNKITRYILVPGSVHLRRPKDQHRRNSGFQFLATCQQAYEEGHVFFYSLNTFYIPPGPLDQTFRYLEIL